MARPDGRGDNAPDDSRGEKGQGGTHSHTSSLGGSVVGDVVQARDIQGGVHFHAALEQHVRPVPRQLPTDLQGFVNRMTELQRLDAILTDAASSVGVLVMAGTAGVGKTSLALHWAHSVREQFPDGQLYADLRGYDPEAPVAAEQVLERFLRALDVGAAAIPTDREAMAASFRSLVAGRRMLIVLDNAATAAQVRPLLPGAPGCLVVVTSRNRLSGLSVREGARRITVDVLGEAEAIALLRTVTAGYRHDDDTDELSQLAALCARLPLALRIAAERAASRPRMLLDDLIRDLRDESSLWDALSTEDGEESEAVRTVFAWSYRALPSEAARLFRLLGLHPGPEFSDLAAAVVAGTTTRRARRLLDTLVGTHMVEQTAPDRYRFHDLLRAYATEQAHRDETPQACRDVLRHVLAWYLHAADAAAACIVPQEPRVPLESLGPDTTVPVFSGYDEAIRWYEAERDNLVAATRAAADAQLHRIAWQLAVVLRGIYMDLNPFQDWLTTSRIGLDAARRDGDRHAEAELYESLGMAYTQSHQLQRGAEHYQAALVIRRERGDTFGEALTLNGLGLLFLRQRQLHQAQSALQRSLALFGELDDAYWAPVVAVNLANVHVELGQLTEAARLVQGGLEVFRAHGDRWCEGNALRVLSTVHLESGRFDEALDCAQRAVDAAVDLDNPVAEGYWLIDLGHALRATGQPAQALTSYHRAAVLQRRLGDRSREATAWDGAGLAYLDLGRGEEAADFHRRAAATHHELGDRWQHAVALDHLATALDQAGASETARHQRQQALSILGDLDDPKALHLRERITRALDLS